MNWPMLCGTFWKTPKWGFWFRVYGYGIVITAMEPSFSERYSYKKVFRIFGIKLEFLKAGKGCNK